MIALNKVFLIGNLTRDPELRYTPSGKAVATMGLAVSERYRSKTGEMVENTCFLDLEAWGRQAEICAEYLTKGSQILVEGRLKMDQWETPQGEKRTRLRVVVDRVQFMSAPKKAEHKDVPSDLMDAGTPTGNHAPELAKEEEEDLPF